MLTTVLMVLIAAQGIKNPYIRSHTLNRDHVIMKMLRDFISEFFIQIAYLNGNNTIDVCVNQV